MCKMLTEKYDMLPKNVIHVVENVGRYIITTIKCDTRI